MAHARWDPTSVKVCRIFSTTLTQNLNQTMQALLRLTSQRLGQLQEKKDSKGIITRRDIATLLQQRNVSLARAKTQNLIQEDASGDLLEMLEMHVGLVLEHFHDLDHK